MSVRDILGLRFFTIDRQLAMDNITQQDKEINPFLCSVFRILRGRCKGMLFLVNDVQIDVKDGNHRIDWTFLKFDIPPKRNIMNSDMEESVSRVVKEIFQNAARNVQKKAEMNANDNRESHTQGTLSK